MNNRVTKTTINYDRKVKYILDDKDLAEMCRDRWSDRYSFTSWSTYDIEEFHASILNTERSLGEWLKEPEEPKQPKVAEKVDHKAYSDDNNCTVRALSAVFEQPLHVIYDLLKARGRKHRRAMHTPSYHKAIRELAPEFGYKAVPVDARREYGKTVVSAARQVLAHEKVIFQTAGHTLAVVGGVVCDWTDGRRHHVRPYGHNCSYRIVKA